MTVHAKSKPWRVVRQSSSTADVEVSAHRWEWLAELAAHRAARREPGTGVFFTARPAVLVTTIAGELTAGTEVAK